MTDAELDSILRGHKILRQRDGSSILEDKMADAITALRQERDAAFKMSKCECGPDECCANLVAMGKERDHWREANRSTLAAGDVLKQQLDKALAELADASKNHNLARMEDAK